MLMAILLPVTSLNIVAYLLAFNSVDYPSGYGSVLKQKQAWLLSERCLPNGGHKKSEEGVNLPLGGSNITLEHEQTHLLEVSEEANGALRGGERQVATKEEEREDVSDEV
jgi:hypothetical protein